MSAQVESPLARRLFARPLIGALPRREPSSQLLWGPGCAAPALLGFVLRKLMPVAASFAVALTDWNIARSPQRVGLENFRRMLLHDPLFWKSLWATGVYAAVRRTDCHDLCFRAGAPSERRASVSSGPSSICRRSCRRSRSASYGSGS